MLGFQHVGGRNGSQNIRWNRSSWCARRLCLVERWRVRHKTDPPKVFFAQWLKNPWMNELNWIELTWIELNWLIACLLACLNEWMNEWMNEGRKEGRNEWMNEWTISMTAQVCRHRDILQNSSQHGQHHVLFTDNCPCLGHEHPLVEDKDAWGPLFNKTSRPRDDDETVESLWSDWDIPRRMMQAGCCRSIWRYESPPETQKHVKAIKQLNKYF